MMMRAPTPKCLQHAVRAGRDVQFMLRMFRTALAASREYQARFARMSFAATRAVAAHSARRRVAKVTDGAGS